MDVDYSMVRFVGNLVLNLWDCGGQAAFFQSYFDSQKDHIFKNVEVLIHVFDVVSEEMEKDIESFTQCVEAIHKFSASAKVFVLIHKMDLVPEDLRDEKYGQHESRITKICENFGIRPMCFRTSIWDETLYRAWSTIVTALIPNVDL